MTLGAGTQANGIPSSRISRTSDSTSSGSTSIERQFRGRCRLLSARGGRGKFRRRIVSESAPYHDGNVSVGHSRSGEIQFHTEQEIAIKNKFHEQYEIERNSDVPRRERAEAREVMVVAWRDVEQPPGVVDLSFGDVVVVAKPYPNRYKKR